MLTIAPPPLCLIAGTASPTLIYSLDIDEHDSIEPRLRDVERGLVLVGGACVVDEGVETAELGDHGVDYILPVGLGGYVSDERGDVGFVFGPQLVHTTGGALRGLEKLH